MNTPNAVLNKPLTPSQLKTLIADSRFTQAEVAYRLGLSPRTIRTYISPKGKPPPYLVGYAATVLCEDVWNDILPHQSEQPSPQETPK